MNKLIEFIKNLFRRSNLKRNSSKVPTGILPLSQIKSYVAIIDVEEPLYNTCKDQVMNYFRSRNIRGSIFFQDFRKIGNEDRLITSIQTTITRKDVNWFGKPSKYKLDVMEELNPDLFICLIRDPEFPIEYLVRTSKARFKVGRKQINGNLFDLVINDPKDKPITELESFKAMKSYLEKIG